LEGEYEAVGEGNQAEKTAVFARFASGYIKGRTRNPGQETCRLVRILEACCTRLSSSHTTGLLLIELPQWWVKWWVSLGFNLNAT
jgi:hypothetical protein